MSTELYRILDANLNRAREGLRVVEEYLRFIREDRRASWRLKRWRHEIGEISRRLGPDELLKARSAVTDVGKELESPSISAKKEPRDIASASLKRLQEALRSIEEYACPIDPGAGALAGKMRFEVYQFERELLVGDPRSRFERVRLYLLIGTDFYCQERIVDLADRLMDAGVDCLQLREKNLTDRELLRLSDQLAEVCRKRDKLFIVNDRADIARIVGADGVHVGQGDLPAEAARQIVGPDRMIGLSTHNFQELHHAIEQGPTYIAIGPAFDTTTKPHEPTAGLGYIAEATRELRAAGIPEVAIGGITLENLPELLALGIKRISLCSAILSADDPVRQAAQFAAGLR